MKEELCLKSDVLLQALERDLAYFLGKDWNGASYEIRPEVAKYLARLKVVEAENPYLLVAYIYHMYMGLLSGGQVRLQVIVIPLKLEVPQVLKGPSDMP